MSHLNEVKVLGKVKVGKKWNRSEDINCIKFEHSRAQKLGMNQMTFDKINIKCPDHILDVFHKQCNSQSTKIWVEAWSEIVLLIDF